MIEYESTFRTYQTLLKVDPDNRRAMELQVDSAMRWREDFHIVGHEGARVEDLVSNLLAEIAPVLDAGLARTVGRGRALPISWPRSDGGTG